MQWYDAQALTRGMDEEGRVASCSGSTGYIIGWRIGRLWGLWGWFGRQMLGVRLRWLLLGYPLG